MSKPKVTVLMAVYNGLPYLQEAVDSILSQTTADLEFLIVDDASTDGSGDVLKSYRDSRVGIITNKRQSGLARSLNKGLKQSRGEYVARMDHDDISLPTRLEKQSAFLDEHPEIDLIGAWARTMGLRPEQTWKYPLSDGQIRSEFLFNSALIHSSVMFRRPTFDRLRLRYDTKLKQAQDFELWTRAARRIRFANLGEVLLRYRIHDAQVGERFSKDQQAVAARVRVRELKRLGLQPSRAELRLHNQASIWRFPKKRAGLGDLEEWFLKLRAANLGAHLYPIEDFDLVLENRWWAACKSNVANGLEAWSNYMNSRLAGNVRRGLFDKVQFWLKCLLREWGWKRVGKSAS